MARRKKKPHTELNKTDILPGDEVTPEHVYLSRRKFIAGVGAVAATTLITACNRRTPGTTTTPPTQTTPTTTAAESFCDDAAASTTTDELGEPLTACDDVTNFNNFYEFTYDKREVADLSRNFDTSSWTITVGGLVDKPGSYSVDELIERYQPEERIYRMRCVEGWYMVIPWIGFPLTRLLQDVQPQPEAGFVRFESFYDPEKMPGDKSLPFPYFEGLRLDEAIHDLTIMATGLYNKPLPPQSGVPIRLVVPWKYGFKSAKSIIRIDLTADMPKTFWSTLTPSEYGFYANVNPNVDHPRWSQASERRIGDSQIRPTTLFNGYSQVAPLYEGMDLKENF